MVISGGQTAINAMRHQLGHILTEQQIKLSLEPRLCGGALRGTSEYLSRRRPDSAKA